MLALTLRHTARTAARTAARRPHQLQLAAALSTPLEQMEVKLKAELGRRSYDKGGDDDYTGESATWRRQNMRGTGGGFRGRGSFGGGGGGKGGKGHANSDKGGGGGGGDNGGNSASAKRAVSAGAKT